MESLADIEVQYTLFTYTCLLVFCMLVIFLEDIRVYNECLTTYTGSGHICMCKIFMHFRRTAAKMYNVWLRKYTTSVL